MSFSSLSGHSSTADAVLAALGTHSWAHLACHGRSNVEKPFDASFALKDRVVTVLDVIRGAKGRDSNSVTREHVNVGDETKTDGTNANAKDDSKGSANVSVNTDHANPNADAVADREFAFLSACHTAVGDRTAPDETIHLAAAMQFAGFRSVIGTMWAVDDAMVTAMVKAFYENLFLGATGQLGGNEKETNQEYKYDYTQAARALNKAAKLVDKGQVSLDQRIVFIHIGV
ncbi:hypothetical protein JVU11DRAFT_3772 [Chiua virens]|nr:hypothetical protein JVU11DRAFT_3772 [Chiua virens]